MKLFVSQIGKKLSFYQAKRFYGSLWPKFGRNSTEIRPNRSKIREPVSGKNEWPKMTVISALAAAQVPEIYFDAHIQNAEQLKTELFTDEGRFMIDTIRNGILGGGVTPDIINTLEMVCDKCSNYEPKLSDVQNMLLFPDLSEDGKFRVFSSPGAQSGRSKLKGSNH